MTYEQKYGISTGATVQIRPLIGRDYCEGLIGTVIAKITVSGNDCFTVQFPDESTIYARACELREL